MLIPWYAYAVVLLVGILAGITATLASEIPFGLGKRARSNAVKVDNAATAALVTLLVLDVVGWFQR